MYQQTTILGEILTSAVLSHTPTGIAKATFVTLVSVERRDENGEKQERRDVYHVTVWGHTAENTCKFLKNGKRVWVVGTVNVGKCTGESGETKAHIEMGADRIVFADTGKKSDIDEIKSNSGIPF